MFGGSKLGCERPAEIRPSPAASRARASRLALMKTSKSALVVCNNEIERSRAPKLGKRSQLLLLLLLLSARISAKQNGPRENRMAAGPWVRPSPPGAAAAGSAPIERMKILRHRCQIYIHILRPHNDNNN
jgi:hypothetical protein